LLGCALWVGWAVLRGSGRLKPLALILSVALLAVGGVAALTVGIWISATLQQFSWSAPVAVGVAALLMLTTIANVAYVAVEVFAPPSLGS
ncbi:MAG: hypothetical protein SNJ67_02605, partial [Chloracidobacterium sp.]